MAPDAAAVVLGGGTCEVRQNNFRTYVVMSVPFMGIEALQPGQVTVPVFGRMTKVPQAPQNWLMVLLQGSCVALVLGFTIGLGLLN